MINTGRYTARIDGEFAVFLIGMRINKPLRVDKWMPVMAAMPRMLKELAINPDLGLLHYDMWVGRTVILVQYWRSLDQLMNYALDRDAHHLPAWQAFNKAATDDSVGIWHETYVSGPGRYENVYVNMPTFGLGRAVGVIPAEGSLARARDRISL